MSTLTKVKTGFAPIIRSRHPSHQILREKLGRFPFRSIVRLGSTTMALPNNKSRVECNSVKAVKTSADKLLMKKAFTRDGVITPNWYTAASNTGFYHFDDNDEIANINDLEYPIIAKHRLGSRGTGNYKLNTRQELESWMQGKSLPNYIFEQFYSYSREYRLHVTSEGVFYACRKVLKPEIEKSKRWVRNDVTCNWLVESNPSFDKPVNWDKVVVECIKALKAVGLDIGAFDLKIQSAKTESGKARKDPAFIVIESASAPSFGTITGEKYLVEIPKVLRKKHELRM